MLCEEMSDSSEGQDCHSRFSVKSESRGIKIVLFPVSFKRNHKSADILYIRPPVIIKTVIAESSYLAAVDFIDTMYTIAVFTVRKKHNIAYLRLTPERYNRHIIAAPSDKGLHAYSVKLNFYGHDLACVCKLTPLLNRNGTSNFCIIQINPCRPNCR